MNQIHAPAFEVNPEVIALAAKIKLVLFDVDGVLTDGRIVISDDGQEYKAFNSRDGHGIKMLLNNNIAVGVITSRTSEVVKHRMQELDIKHIYQGCAEKLPVFRRLIAELRLAPEQTAYVGDDVLDLPIMLQAGLAIAVLNAHPIAKKYAHWITPSIGGYGAAREACELILYAHGVYHAEIQKLIADAGH